MSIIPKLTYPNVSNLLGVPALHRALNTNTTVMALAGIAEGMMWRKINTEERWGIYKNGKPYLLADTVVDLSVSSYSQVATYTQANVNGIPSAFASYNKVNAPKEFRIRLIKGGGLTWAGRAEDDRATFLTALEAAKNTTDLYDVMTPEITYHKCTIENYDYRREQTSGAYMIIADITLREIRTVDVAYTTESKIEEQPKSENGADPSSNGQVQGQEVDKSKNQSVMKMIEIGKVNKQNLNDHFTFLGNIIGGI